MHFNKLQQGDLIVLECYYDIIDKILLILDIQAGVGEFMWTEISCMDMLINDEQVCRMLKFGTIDRLLEPAHVSVRVFRYGQLLYEKSTH